MLSQEIETFYLIPAIRKAIVELMIERKKSKKEICECLKLTKSAISQYISKKRVKSFKLNKVLVEECCESLLKGKNHVFEIQELIKNLKESKLICQIYKENNLIPEDCGVCENAGLFR